MAGKGHLRRSLYILTTAVGLAGILAGFQNLSLPTISTFWVVAFQDEFNGTSLDSSKWATSFRWNSRTISKNKELQCYRDNRLSIAGGELRLTAVPENSTCNDGTALIRTQFTSGMISSKFNHTYGYIEFRAKIPKGSGFWSALWLNSAAAWPPEIDVAEILGYEPSRTHMNVHWGTASAPQNASSSFNQTWTPDFSQAYHVFAVDWQPGLLIWYVDGIERKRFTGPNVPSTAHYVLANLAVGGWGGTPDYTKFPGQMKIDYIRVLQRASKGATRNLLSNPSFEEGVIGWQTHGVTSLSPLSRFGTRALRMDQEAGATRTVTGLRPYSRYTLMANLRSLNGKSVMIGVKNYGGGDQLFAATSAASYNPQSLTFTTGNTTAATIFVYQPPGSIGLADDFFFGVAP